MLWVLCEIAIVACNIAEVLGMAIGLNLLFGLPLLAGVCITVVDVMLILALQRRGFRSLEAVVIGLVLLIGVCFAAQIVWLQPPLAAVLSGFLPRAEIVTNSEMLYLAVGIVGATVMPHNLYLHSSIVQTRAKTTSTEGKEGHDRLDGGARPGAVRQRRHHDPRGRRIPSARASAGDRVVGSPPAGIESAVTLALGRSRRFSENETVLPVDMEPKKVLP